MTLRTLLSALFSPMPAVVRAERDLLRSQNTALKLALAERDQRIQKLNELAHFAINRNEHLEAQLAIIRGRDETMALVHPWAREGFDA
jgi:hypothetical protein